MWAFNAPPAHGPRSPWVRLDAPWPAPLQHALQASRVPGMVPGRDYLSGFFFPRATIHAHGARSPPPSTPVHHVLKFSHRHGRRPSVGTNRTVVACGRLLGAFPRPPRPPSDSGVRDSGSAVELRLPPLRSRARGAGGVGGASRDHEYRRDATVSLRSRPRASRARRSLPTLVPARRVRWAHHNF